MHKLICAFSLKFLSNRITIILLSILCLCSCQDNAARTKTEKNSYPDSLSINSENKKTKDPNINLWNIYQTAKEIQLKGFYHSMFVVQNEHGYGIVTANNKVVLPITSEQMLYHKESFVRKNNNLYEFYSGEKDPIAQLELDSIYHNFIGNYYVGVKNKLKHVIEMNGTIVSKNSFEEIEFPKDNSYFFGLKDNNWKAYNFDGKILPANHASKFSLNILNNFVVTLRSFGPVVLGSSVSKIEKVLGYNLHKQNIGEQCHTYTLGPDQINITFLTENKMDVPILERIYINAFGVKTKSNIGVGDLEKTLKVIYQGYLENSRGHYDTTAVNYFFVPKDEIDKNYRINFYVNNSSIIESYSIGRQPAIQYVEGCF